MKNHRINVVSGLSEISVKHLIAVIIIEMGGACSTNGGEEEYI
jgi:hypothetical protein